MKRRQFIKGADVCVACAVLPMPQAYTILEPTAVSIPSIGLAEWLVDIAGDEWIPRQIIEMEFSTSYSASREAMLSKSKYWAINET